MAQITSLRSGINLIPEEITKPQPVRKAVQYGLLATRYGLVVSIVVVLGLVVYSVILNNSLRNAVAQIESDLTFVESKRAFERDFQSLQAYTGAIAVTHGQLTKMAPLFERLESITPQVIALRDFSVRDGTLRLTGRTFVYASISDYVTQLTESNVFESVQIVSISRPETEGIPFIEFTLDVGLQQQSAEE